MNSTYGPTAPARRRRAARIAAGALAALALAIALGGPTPVLRSVRAAAIFGAVLPVCLLSGGFLGLAAWRLAHACVRYGGGAAGAQGFRPFEAREPAAGFWR